MFNNKTYFKISFFIFLTFSLSNCGGGIGTAPPSNSLFVQPGISALTLGDYPADIDILDQPDLKNTAFVTLTNPASVIAIDLEKARLGQANFQSENFKGLPSSALNGLGYPNSLEILDSTHAFLLTSIFGQVGSVVFFNPQTGFVYQNLSLNKKIIVPQNSSLRKVDKKGTLLQNVAGLVDLSIPASLAVVRSGANIKLLISFSNLNYNQNNEIDYALQGIVRIFNVQLDPASISPSGFVAAQCGDPSVGGFNATGLTPLSTGKVLLTCTGLTERNDAQNSSVPVTPGGVDLIDPFSETVLSTVDLHLTAPAFREWAVQSDGTAYLGSSTYNYLLKINIQSSTVSESTKSPFLIIKNERISDYINDVVLNEGEGVLFVMSFNRNSVYRFGIGGEKPEILPDFYDLSFKASLGGVSGSGPTAIRPGKAGVDFTGPDLFVLTGFPGTMAGIKTY